MKMLKIGYLIMVFIIILAENIGANMLYKADITGQILWTWRRWAGYYESIDKLAITDDGDIYATDMMSGSLYKFSTDGTLLWNEIVYIDDGQGASGSEGHVADLLIDDDGGILATGNYVAKTGCSGFVARISSEGELIWAKGATIADNAYSQNSSQIIRMDQERNLYIGGEAVKNHKIYHYHDFFVAKFDEEGRQQWTVINDVFKGDDLRWIEVTEDGDIYAAGYSYDYTYSKTIFYFVVFKINKDGRLLWTTHYNAGQYYAKGNNQANPIILMKERDESSIGLMKAGLDGEGCMHLIGTTWPGIEKKQIVQITIDIKGEIIEEIIYQLDWQICSESYDLEPDDNFNDVYGAITICEDAEQAVFFRVNGETGVVWSVVIDGGYGENGYISDMELYNNDIFVAAHLDGPDDLYRINKDGKILWQQAIERASMENIEIKDDYIYIAGTSVDDDDSSSDEDDDDDDEEGCGCF